MKRLRRLVTRRSEREATATCVVEGPRAISAALASGCEVFALYVESDAAPLRPLVDAALDRGLWVHTLEPGTIERVATTTTPQPIVATVGIPTWRLDQLDLSLVVVLDAVADPGNAGTIVRTAEGAGATAVIFGRGTADAFSTKVVRASAGAVFQIPVVQGATTSEVLDDFGQARVRRFGTAPAGGLPYDEVDWTTESALVLGNEATGVHDDLRSRIDQWVSIPMPGKAESLNVAMAPSVLLFEAARQRRPSGPG